MTEPKDRDSLSEADSNRGCPPLQPWYCDDYIRDEPPKEAFNGSLVYNFSNIAYPHSVIIKDSYRNPYERTGYLNLCVLSPMVSCTPEDGKDEGISDHLVNDTQPREEVSESTMGISIIQPSSTERHTQPTHGSSLYFRCNFPNFCPQNVDLNKTGVIYQYGHNYYVVVQLPHPHTGEPALICGFLHRGNVGSYLTYEWESLLKEPIGKWGIALCGDDGRWVSCDFTRCRWPIH